MPRRTPPPRDDDRLMTLEEVAAYLSVPPSTVYRWNSHRDGPRYLKIGKYARYRRADLDEWLAGHVRRGGAA